MHHKVLSCQSVNILHTRSNNNCFTTLLLRQFVSFNFDNYHPIMIPRSCSLRNVHVPLCHAAKLLGCNKIKVRSHVTNFYALFHSSLLKWWSCRLLTSVSRMQCNVPSSLGPGFYGVLLLLLLLCLMPCDEQRGNGTVPQSSHNKKNQIPQLHRTKSGEVHTSVTIPSITINFL